MPRPIEALAKTLEAPSGLEVEQQKQNLGHKNIQVSENIKRVVKLNHLSLDCYVKALDLLRWASYSMP